MSKNKKSKTSENQFDQSGIVKILWIAVFAGLLVMCATFIMISMTQMPDTNELENPKFEESSLIYSSDDAELGRYYVKNRDLVTFEDLNPLIVDALIATEDERFFEHSGIDTRGTIRAFAYMGKRGGASTITQQLAKLFFVNRSRSTFKRLWQKLKEWTIAVQFEKRYTKEEICAMYLNKAEYPYNSYGIGAASQTYFGKKQEDISLDQAAILVGMLKSPFYYNPKSFPENAKKRRNIVMKQMLRNRYITQDEYDEYAAKEINMDDFKKSLHYDGLAPYFRFELTKWLKDLLSKDAFQKPDGTKYDIYSDGLKIYTTLDSRMQRHAEEAMEDHMATVQKNFFTHWKGRDPWTDKNEKASLDLRKSDFNNMVRGSERFQNLKSKYMSEVITAVSDEVSDTKWRDIDVMRMIREHAKTGHLAQLVRQKTITKSQASTYKEIMKSSHWERLLSQWRALEKKSKKVFSVEREMTVFAYSPSGEKTVTMSPLDSIRYHAMHLHIGSMSVEPQTGHIKTWVGGIGNKYFQFDHVNNKGKRQVGSTFKPFLYATAVSQLAMSPCRRVSDSRYEIPRGESNFKLLKTWSPENSDGKFTNEKMTLNEALKQSKNSISVWLMIQLGSVSIVKDLVEQMGIDRNRVADGPAMALGASNLSVWEMTGAYSTFANNGIYTEPQMVVRIEDSRGRVIYNAAAVQDRALSEDTNYAMVNMLKHASSSVRNNIAVEFGGKTGTTNDFTDGWFMGITPNLVVGTWVGGEKPWVHFRTAPLGYGSQMARPYFIEFIERIERDDRLKFDSEATFFIPEDMEIEVDCSKYDSLYYRDLPAEPELIEDEFEDEF